MPVTIEIQNLQTKIPISPAAIKTAIRKVLKKLELKDGLLSFVFVDDRKMRAVNKCYLNHDYATDVLTFDLSEGNLEGEIVISLQTAKRNAAEYGNSLQAEIVLYMVHGVLHLLGYDDHRPSDTKKMRAKEKQLLSSPLRSRREK
jgi:probable rRNA maturation factor